MMNSQSYTLKIVTPDNPFFGQVGRWKDQDEDGLIFIRFPGGEGDWFCPDDFVDIEAGMAAISGEIRARLMISGEVVDPMDWLTPSCNDIAVYHGGAFAALTDTPQPVNLTPGALGVRMGE